MSVQTAEKLIEEVLKSPSARKVTEQLNQQLQQEQEKRKAFYETMTEQEKVEFINGEVIVHSPVQKFHNEISGNLYTIINTYIAEHNLGFLGFEKILLQFTRNDYEPDLCYFNKATADTLKKDQMFFPVPNLVIEVLSKSTEKRDRGVKFEDYQSHGVQEYWIVNPKNETVEQYQNTGQQFDLVLKSNSGSLKVIALPDLEIPIKAVFDRGLTHQFIREMIG